MCERGLQQALPQSAFVTGAVRQPDDLAPLEPPRIHRIVEDERHEARAALGGARWIERSDAGVVEARISPELDGSALSRTREDDRHALQTAFVDQERIFDFEFHHLVPVRHTQKSPSRARIAWFLAFVIRPS
jgi:hypothetical protein